MSAMFQRISLLTLLGMLLVVVGSGCSHSDTVVDVSGENGLAGNSASGKSVDVDETARTDPAAIPTAPQGNETQKSAELKSDDLKAASSETSDWPIFRRDINSTGVATGSFPKEYDVIWKHAVPKGAFEGSPAIVTNPNDANGQVVYIGDLDGKLFAFDLADGKVIWEYSAEIGFATAPAYRNEKIYIGDLDGIFHCVDAGGKKVWTHESGAEINSSANFYQDQVIYGSQDVYLYALNAKTGELVWDHETADQVRCGITIAGNLAFVAGCDGRLHLVDLDKGEEKSSVDIQSPTGITPAVMGDHVFIGTEQAGFFAIDWKQSKVAWHVDCDGAPIRSSAAVTKDHVVFGAQNRTVYSFDPVTGKKNWSRTLRNKVDSSPVILGDRVFVGSTDGRLYELSLSDGAIVWQKQFEGGFLGSPAIAFGRLVIATDRGVVYCLGDAKK